MSKKHKQPAPPAARPQPSGTVSAAETLPAVASGPVAEVTGGETQSAIEAGPVEEDTNKADIAEAGSAPAGVDLSLDDEGEDERLDPDAIMTPIVQAKLREMLREQLAAAERDERLGPGGGGWQHNESKRAEVVEWAVFLRQAAKELERIPEF